MQRRVIQRQSATLASGTSQTDACSFPTSEGVTESMIDSTVLQPAPGQTVVATETGHRSGHHDGDNTRHGRVWEMSRDFASVEGAVCGVKSEVLRSEIGVVSGFKDA